MAASPNKVKVNLDWIESETFEREDPAPFLEHVHGILVPGGFGQRGRGGQDPRGAFRPRAQGALSSASASACRWRSSRRRATCAASRQGQFHRVRPHQSEPVVGLLTEWLKGNELERRNAAGDLGGTMRLGAYEACLEPGSRVESIYGKRDIFERHRHRYEVNTAYRERLEQHGLRFSGMSPDGLLPEIVEHQNHPWFVGVQFHPELKSRPFDPHPLIASFVGAAKEQSRLV